MTENKREVCVFTEEVNSIEKLKNNGDIKQSELLYDALIEKIKTDGYTMKIPERKSSLLGILYNNRGHSKYLQVEFEDAVLDYETAIQYDSQNLKAYYNRGLIKYRMGNFEEARKDMIRVIELDPKFEDATHCLKQCLNSLNCKQIN